MKTVKTFTSRPKDFFSPRELAGAIGVSESSIKRWVDAGRIQTTLTAGGHRRIPLTEALRFVRRSRLTPEQPERLGLVDLAGAETTPEVAPSVGERLFEHLKHGRDASALGLIQSLYLAGQEVPQILDGPFRFALERLGAIWHERREGIFWEHRATQICVRALHRLRALQSPPLGHALSAVGGAPEGDPYLLPSLSVATVLESIGVSTTDLGPHTPISAFTEAVAEQKPDLVWLSATAPLDRRRFQSNLRELLQIVDACGARLLIGGRQSSDPVFADRSRMFVGRSLSELAAFVRGLETR